MGQSFSLCESAGLGITGSGHTVLPPMWHDFTGYSDSMFANSFADPFLAHVDSTDQSPRVAALPPQNGVYDFGATLSGYNASNEVASSDLAPAQWISSVPYMPIPHVSTDAGVVPDESRYGAEMLPSEIYSGIHIQPTDLATDFSNWNVSLPWNSSTQLSMPIDDGMPQPQTHALRVYELENCPPTQIERSEFQSRGAPLDNSIAMDNLSIGCNQAMLARPTGGEHGQKTIAQHCRTSQTPASPPSHRPGYNKMRTVKQSKKDSGLQLTLALPGRNLARGKTNPTLREKKKQVRQVGACLLCRLSKNAVSLKLESNVVWLTADYRQCDVGRPCRRCLVHFADWKWTPCAIKVATWRIDKTVKKLSTPRGWSQEESLRVLDLWVNI